MPGTASDPSSLPAGRPVWPKAPWLLPLGVLAVAYGLLGLTLTEPLTHSQIMQRCVLVDPARSRLWSVGNVEVGMAYLGVFGGMLFYFLRAYAFNRQHVRDLGLALAYLFGSFALDYACVQFLHPFTALLIGDAVVITFTALVSRQVWFQRLLGVFVPLVFLTCGVGHFLEGLSYWRLTYPVNVPWTMVTADIGFAILLNAGRFPAFIRGEDVVEALTAERSRADALQQQIDARLRAEEDRRASDDLYRRLFETMAQGVVYQDADGAITAANPAAQRLLGLTLNQMQGRTPTDPRWGAVRDDGAALPADEHPSIVTLRTGLPVRDFLMGVYNPDLEQTRWLRIGVTPEFHGGAASPFRVCSVFEDITERRAAEAALEESEHLRRTALMGAPIVLWAMDAQGTITLAEGSGLALVGQSAAGYVGRSVFDLSQDPTLRTAWRSALAGEPAAYDTWNGGVLFHNVLSPRRDAGGSVTAVVGVAFDVTERETAMERQKVLLRDVLSSVTGGKLRLVETAADLPGPLTEAGDPIPLTPTEGLAGLRRQANGIASGLGFADERCFDLMTAASEGGMNTITHGGGYGEARVSSDTSAIVQVRVQDWGTGINTESLPKATLARGWSSGESLGHGLVMMIESVDRLWLLTGPEGTTVVMEKDREEPLPAWLEAAGPDPERLETGPRAGGKGGPVPLISSAR
jgi:PAS domain S-box-containing protein